MAVALRSVSTFSVGPGTTLTSTAPSGKASGDTLLLAVYVDALSSGIVTPTGWTRLDVVAATTDPFCGAIFWRVADGTATDLPVIAWGGSSHFADGLMAAYTGAHATAPINVSGAINVINTASTSAGLNSVTTTVNNCLAVGILMVDSGDTHTPPANWTEDSDVSFIPKLIHKTALVSPAAAVGAATSTFSGSNRYLTMMLAIKPPSGATVTVNQATETELAQPVKWAPKKRIPGQPVETDLAQSVSALLGSGGASGTLGSGTLGGGTLGSPSAGGHTVAMGQAVETQTAQAIARLKFRPVAQAADLQTAQPIGRVGTKFIAVNQAVQIETAQAVTVHGVLKPARFTIRERPPLRHSIEVITPKGVHTRWGYDAPNPENVFRDMTFTDTCPGGDENLDLTLARAAQRQFFDLDEFSRLNVRNYAGRIIRQYRLERQPRTSGPEHNIAPGAVGYQADLDDNKSVRFIYVDRDMTKWTGPSINRRVDLLSSAFKFQPNDPTTAVSPQGDPCNVLEITDDWSGTVPISELWYDSQGMGVGAAYMLLQAAGQLGLQDPNWKLMWGVSSDDRATVFQTMRDDIVFADMNFASHLGQAVEGVFDTGTTPSGGNWQQVLIQLLYSSNAAGTPGSHYDVNCRRLAVYGPHDLPLIGGTNFPSDPAPWQLLATDILQHALGTWTDIQYLPGQTIIPSTFPIDHMVFSDPSSVADIVKSCARFELPDWMVRVGRGDQPTMYYAPPGTFSKKWIARSSEVGLSENGPQVDRIWNSVVVQYVDVDGTPRSVGPPGAGAIYSDASLNDTDPLNPANVAGKIRRAILQMGTAVLASAVQTGAVWLQLQKELDTSGEAQLVGWVQDDKGMWYPASEVRSGDYIAFTDAHDFGYRKIVSGSYSDSSKTNSIKLDQPPDAMNALLERMQVKLVALGFSS